MNLSCSALFHTNTKVCLTYFGQDCASGFLGNLQTFRRVFFLSQLPVAFPENFLWKCAIMVCSINVLLIKVNRSVYIACRTYHGKRDQALNQLNYRVKLNQLNKELNYRILIYFKYFFYCLYKWLIKLISKLFLCHPISIAINIKSPIRKLLVLTNQSSSGILIYFPFYLYSYKK